MNFNSVSVLAAPEPNFTSLAQTEMDNDQCRMLRTALGQFATGVTVILTEMGDTFHGMTANAFTAVSLEPPLILVSVSNGAKTASAIRKSSRFSVNLLAQSQKNVSSHFAGHGDDAPPSVAWSKGRTPYLSKALGTFICTVFDTVEAGDHTLFLGEVQAYRHFKDAPLIFYGGDYGRFSNHTEPGNMLMERAT